MKLFAGKVRNHMQYLPVKLYCSALRGLDPIGPGIIRVQKQCTFTLPTRKYQIPTKKTPKDTEHSMSLFSHFRIVALVLKLSILVY